MTDPAQSAAERWTGASAARLRRRHRAETRFRLFGVAAIAIAVIMLALLLVTIVAEGYSAFTQTYLAVDVAYDRDRIDPQSTNDPIVIASADFHAVAREAIRRHFPDVRKRRDKRPLYRLFSTGIEFELRDRVLADRSLIGRGETVWIRAAADIDMLRKGLIRRDVAETERRLSDTQIAWFDRLVAEGRVERRFNTTFFTAADSREPEQAGILGALVGSALTLLVTLGLAFPVGVLSAVYLEEFAPGTWWTDLIEVSINNLAAVPSIIFGLLGLAVLLSFFELPRSSPLVGGIVLALMTLPTIIVSGRAALLAVPDSIRQAALAVGASPVQAVIHHALPLAMPGMLTGTIIGMARALGETAPLLMIGMVAFIVDIPENFVDAATVLPVQIFLWADAPERAFVERTAAATLILLIFLVAMNLAAILLRKRFERRW